MNAKKTLMAILKEQVHCDSIGRTKDGLVVFRQEFFYTYGGTAEKFQAQVVAALNAAKKALHNIPDFTVVDNGEVWKRFNGSASTANSSHWYVKVKFN